MWLLKAHLSNQYWIYTVMATRITTGLIVLALFPSPPAVADAPESPSVEFADPLSVKAGEASCTAEELERCAQFAKEPPTPPKPVKIIITFEVEDEVDDEESSTVTVTYDDEATEVGTGE